MYKLFTTLILICVLVSGVIYYSPVSQAAPLLQDPRPSDGGGGGSNSGGNDSDSDNDDGDDSTSENRCGLIQGDVIHWGVGAMGDIGSKLSTGSWEVSTISASDGKYSLGGLGVGIATLEVVLPPALEDSLSPLIQNAGVYLNCDYPTVANLAIYSGDQIAPPATIELSGPRNLLPGDETPIKVTIKNDLPNEITNVIVTSLTPPGLTATNIEAATIADENLKIVDGGDDGQLAVAFLETIPTGDERNIFVTMMVDSEAENNGQVQQTATLFYSESAAAQASLIFSLGTDNDASPAAPIIEPAAVTPTPEILIAQTAATPQAEEAEATPELTAASTVEPTNEATNDEDFIPPNDLPNTGDIEIDAADQTPPNTLPVTGQNSFFGSENGSNSILPVAGVGLTLLILLIFGVRSVRRTNE